MYLPNGEQIWIAPTTRQISNMKFRFKRNIVKSHWNQTQIYVLKWQNDTLTLVIRVAATQKNSDRWKNRKKRSYYLPIPPK